MFFNKTKHLYYLSPLLLVSSTVFAADDGWDSEQMKQALEASQQYVTAERSFMDDYEEAVKRSLAMTTPQPAAMKTTPASTTTPSFVLQSGRKAPVVHYQDTHISEEELFRRALELSKIQESEKKDTQQIPVAARAFEQPREPKALTQHSAMRPVATQQQLDDLVAYMLRLRFDVRNIIGGIMEAHFDGVVHPACMFADPIAPLRANQVAAKPIEEAKNKIRKSFEQYCGDKGYDYNTALSLLDHMLNRYITDDAAFKNYLKAYEKVYETLTAPTLSLLPLIQAKLALMQNMGQPGVMEKLPDVDKALEEGTQKHEVSRLYKVLEEEHQKLAAFLRNPIAPAAFLASAPKVDLARLMKIKQEAAQPADKAPIESAKPVYIDRKATPLDPLILTFKTRLDQLFEEKMKATQRDPAESVMVFGKTVAPAQYKTLEENINRLWNVLPKSTNISQPIVTIPGLIDFYRPILVDLGHKAADVVKVEGALNHSAPTNTANQFDREILKDKRPHEYLFMVFSHVYRYYQMVKPHNPNSANTLMAVFFNGIIEQGTHCQAGLVGRLHQIHKQTFDMMIDYYEHTPVK